MVLMYLEEKKLMHATYSIFVVVVFLLCFAFDWYTCAMSIVYEVHKPYVIRQ